MDNEMKEEYQVRINEIDRDISCYNQQLCNLQDTEIVIRDKIRVLVAERDWLTLLEGQNNE